jgi:nitrogen-specific signal transduction histidine kinase
MSKLDTHHAANDSKRGSSATSASVKSITTDNDADEKIRALVADYEARMDAVADAITRVRHEINNPLTGVLGQAQLLLREELSEKTRKRVETIEQLAIRIRDIVAKLRTVQRTSKN